MSTTIITLSNNHHQICSQRKDDGYINATLLCKNAGKEIGGYLRSQSTQDFLGELSQSMQIRIDLLIQKIMDGANENRGTWVHPQVAINLAQWLSPKFAVQVSKWVLDWMSGKTTQTISHSLPTQEGKWNYHNITKIREELFGCKIEKLPLSRFDHARHEVDKYMCLKYINTSVYINPKKKDGAKQMGANGKLVMQDGSCGIESLSDIDFSNDNPYEVASFTKNGTTFYSLFDFGEIETMQKNGVFYYVARLPQEMKIKLNIGGYYQMTYKKSELEQMFSDYPKIFLTEIGVETLMRLLKEKPQNAIAQEARNLLAA